MTMKTDAEKVLDQALDECVEEADFSENEMTAFTYRLATDTLNEKDRVLLNKRNRKARLVIH